MTGDDTPPLVALGQDVKADLRRVPASTLCLQLAILAMGVTVGVGLASGVLMANYYPYEEPAQTLMPTLRQFRMGGAGATLVCFGLGAWLDFRGDDDD